MQLFSGKIESVGKGTYDASSDLTLSTLLEVNMANASLPKRTRNCKRSTSTQVRDRIICRRCFRYHENPLKKTTIWCEGCARWLDAKYRPYADIKAKDPIKAVARLESMKSYDREHKRDRAKKNRERIRLTNFNRVSNNNPVCENCGCDDLRLLEINHKNGGGTQERNKGKDSNKFANDIFMGRRGVDDLNLLCKVCNALHYLEMKFGKLPFEVKYDAKI